MKKLNDTVITALLWLRNLISRFILALIRPIINDTVDKINRMQQDNLSTAFIHQKTFPQYKDIYVGRDVAIIGCGPSLNNYVPIPGAISIGVNRAYRNEKVSLDYLFIIDGKCFGEQETREIADYRPDGCKKFLGLTNERSRTATITPESITQIIGANRFRTDATEWADIYNPQFSYDISTQPLADFGSCTFPAIQFALWTNPKRVYLVGCDCTNSGYFYNSNSNLDLPTKKLINGYRKLKEFASLYYPGTEIISVNPVALKGMFKDMWQQPNHGDDK